MTAENSVYKDRKHADIHGEEEGTCAHGHCQCSSYRISLGCLMKRIISASLISALLEPWSCGKSKAQNLHSIFVFDLIIKEITLLFKRPAVARELCLGFFS